MSDIFAALQTPAPAFSMDEAAGLLRDYYYLEGDVEALVSERDQNFLVSEADGNKYVLKFASAAEAADVTDFQVRALQHIARVDPEFPVPRVIGTRDDKPMFEVTSEAGTRHRVRLLSWLDGVPLQHAEGVSSIATPTGTCLARLGVALSNFNHAASDYPLLWDISNAAHLSELLGFVDDDQLRQLCESRLDRFQDVVKPNLDTLRMQVIYNDMNPSNILVDNLDVNHLTGVIDFGDMIYSQLVNDVAVAAAYLCQIEDDPFAEVLDFLSAYTEIMPLTDDEMSVLPDLILTRHLTTVMITHWRASLYPENRDYILRNEARARQMLFIVARLSIDETVARFRDACRREPLEAAT